MQRLLLIAVYILSPLLVSAQTHEGGFERKYVLGETYRYQLITEYSQRGQWKSTTTAVCELKVVADSMGVPYDEVRWISQRTVTATDTVDEDHVAMAVKPYRISLHPKGKLLIPAIEEAGMTGAITDFNTFFVAASPQTGITSLSKERNFVKKEPVKGDFSNDKTILKGEDCLIVTAHITGEAANQIIIATLFDPPTTPCLDYLAESMNQPVVSGVPNNFQMIMPAGNQRFNVQYGREYFHITTEIKKSDGRILTASMINELTLQMKISCDKNYSDCQTEIPWSIYRTLKLKLL